MKFIQLLSLFFLLCTPLTSVFSLQSGQSGKQKNETHNDRTLPKDNNIITPSELHSKNPISPQDIINRFAVKESEFRDARANYTFRQEVKIQTLDFDNRPNGEYLRISEILFTDKGKRTERIVKFPPATLEGLDITPADLHDLANIQPFSLTKEELSKYEITYIGKEQLDEINTYAFDVKPKSIPKFRPDGERFFLGRVWVDDEDFQIVKTFGKAVPENENNRFLRFQTYRENIDDKYWFPTYTFGEDTLDFPTGSIRIRLEIKYTNYKQFKTNVKILDE